MNDVPQVGDRRMESFITRGDNTPCKLSNPEPCVVTYVNYQHRWYEVYFERFGFRSGYKFDDSGADPRTDPAAETADPRSQRHLLQTQRQSDR